MNRLLTILLLSPLFLFAQKKQPINAAYIDKQLLQVKDALYASKFECSNNEYRSFLNALLAEGDTASYRRWECDTLEWLRPYVFNQVYMLHYHRHPAYADYPVVNIDHGGALAYCAWLTELYNNSASRKFKKVRFMLPDAAQWRMAAMNGDTLKTARRFAVAGPGTSLRGAHWEPLANYTIIPDDMIVKDSLGSYYVNDKPRWVGRYTGLRVLYMDPVKGTYPPTAMGFYNLAGNVAEMTAVPGHTRGGSWYSSGGYLLIDGPDENAGFSEGNPTIGFRVFMEVIEK